jgi:SMC interacting uncharacterized protein involved in chromosome segregation
MVKKVNIADIKAAVLKDDKLCKLYFIDKSKILTIWNSSTKPIFLSKVHWLTWIIDVHDHFILYDLNGDVIKTNTYTVFYED